jgi:hypothetical protein
MPSPEIIAHLEEIEQRIIELERVCQVDGLVVGMRSSRRLIRAAAAAEGVSIMPQRRAEDGMRYSRAQFAGMFMIFMSLLQGGAAMADISETIHAVFEATASGLLLVGGALLVLLRDPRCLPKVERWNNLLYRWGAKRLHVEEPPSPPTPPASPKEPL